MPNRDRASRNVIARFLDYRTHDPDHAQAARRPWWRPVVRTEVVLLLVAIYFALTANGAFWAEVRQTGIVDGTRGIKLYIGITLALIGLHGLLFGLLLNRWIVKPALSFLLIATAATAYFSSKYAVYIDPSMIRNALRTDVTEARELMTADLWLTVLMMGVLPTVALWLTRIQRVGVRAAFVRRLVYLLGMLAVTYFGLMLSFHDASSLMRNNKSLRYLIGPGNYLVSVPKVLTEEAKQDKGPKAVVAGDARLAGHAQGAKPHLLIIVVGETVRAQNWGLNGYQRQTTPQLSKLDVINFSDVTACGSNTEVSVPCMFSLSGRRDYDRDRIVGSESLLHVLERAGIKTLWRDNQTGCKGVCDGLAFESYRKPPVDPLCDDQACRDAVMLKGLHDTIDDNPGDVVVVLHQLGNHGPAYFKRYPEELRQFRPDCRSSDFGKCTRDEIVNAYDNAILETDDFLAKTIKMLQQDTSHDTAMIYVSDHGESLGESNVYLHGFPYAIAPQAQIKVPMVAWLSEGMKASAGVDAKCVSQRSSQPISHDNLFHSVLGLMRVSTKAYEPGLDLFSRCQTPVGASP
ncbi:lipid A ethanolaminephosphotransferase [Pseudoxanthomonas japonensis]|uniref:phosphoethanolamine transferase n=1 Tax=Pseudoxanthomonas TaxID=83618 RepID=UPI0009F90D0C|nr:MULTISPECIES: phosphoethanolamine--lipid A transferase [Pseudoxanthomonas]MDR7070361.1 lipid A ethanolaminephosphotransferase [Pseudoxanthomonas japonensis]